MILQQGKSSLGAFIKSPFGARTVDATKHAVLQSDGLGSGILFPKLSIGAVYIRQGLIALGYAIADCYPFPINKSSWQTTSVGSFGNGVIAGKYGVQNSSLGVPNRVYTREAIVGMSFTLPDLTGLKSATLQIYVDTVKATIEPASYRVNISTVDDSTNYNSVGSNWYFQNTYVAANGSFFPTTTQANAIPLNTAGILARGSFNNISLVLSTLLTLSQSGASAANTLDGSYFDIYFGNDAKYTPILVLGY